MQQKIRAARRRSQVTSAVKFSRIIVTLILGVVIAINIVAFLTPTSIFVKAHLSAAFLALYLIIEARLYLRNCDAIGLLSPAFLALIFHFFLAYLVGITLSIFYPWVMQSTTYRLPDADSALSEVLLLAGVAAFCMMRGYHVGKPLARSLRRSLQSSVLFRREMRPVYWAAWAMQGAFLLIIGYAISINNYGMISTSETRALQVEVVQYVKIALAAGTLTYFLILLKYFERIETKRSYSLEGLFIGMLMAVHVTAGALTGFKSQIVFPFVIAALAYYLATKRVPLHLVVLACVALLAAYSVVEPFRRYLATQDTLPSSLSEAIVSLSTSFEQRGRLVQQTDISTEEAIASRFDISGVTALAIDYVDSGKLPPEEREEFQNSILLAPILAYIPRALWPSKPSYSATGVWFNQAVLGVRSDQKTSVGMGSIGYLYIVGATIAVVVGFFGFGILQALIFEGFARAGAGGLIVFLSVANTLVQIPSSFGPSLTGVLQMLPAAFIAQMILLSSRNVRAATVRLAP